MSKLTHTLYISALLISLTFLGLFIHFWVQEKEGRVRGEEKFNASQQLLDQREKSFQTQLQDLKGNPQKAQEVVRTIFLQGGGKNALEAPISVPASELTPQLLQALPDAPTVKSDSPVTLLTPPQTEFLASRELTCQKCQADLGDKEKQIKDLEEEMKGGNRFQRFGKAVKCLTVGGIGAGLGALLDKKNPGLGATIGSFSSGATCQIFF